MFLFSKNIRDLQWVPICWTSSFMCRSTELPTDHMNGCHGIYHSLCLQAFSDQRVGKSLQDYFTFKIK